MKERFKLSNESFLARLVKRTYTLGAAAASGFMVREMDLRWDRASRATRRLTAAIFCAPLSMLGQMLEVGVKRKRASQKLNKRASPIGRIVSEWDKRRLGFAHLLRSLATTKATMQATWKTTW